MRRFDPSLLCLRNKKNKNEKQSVGQSTVRSEPTYTKNQGCLRPHEGSQKHPTTFTRWAVTLGSRPSNEIEQSPEPPPRQGVAIQGELLPPPRKESSPRRHGH